MKIADSVWKISNNSNIYILKLGKNIAIDAGDWAYKDKVRRELSKVIDPKKIDMVVFTHLHYDHIGNFSLFENADFFASPEEISSLIKDKQKTILNPLIADMFNIVPKPLKTLPGFEIIPTPGHTKGSICLFYKKERILFSGDTLFFGGIGRIDLPTSVPKEMQASQRKLEQLHYKILCPGHDY